MQRRVHYLESCVCHVPLQAGFCMLAYDPNLVLDTMSVTQTIWPAGQQVKHAST